MLLLHPLSQCDICMSQFSESVPPSAIPCGHVFCSQCFSQAPLKTCAICRRPYISRNIKKLHVDYALVSASESPSPEANLLHRLAEALVLGDSLASPELATAVEEVDRWLSLSAKPWEFKGLRNLRELMDEYNFAHHEYFRLVEELKSAQTRLSILTSSPNVNYGTKAGANPIIPTLPDPSQPSKFESLIDMLKETAWDPDLLPKTQTSDQPQSPRSPDIGQDPSPHAISDYQQFAPQGIASSRFNTRQRGVRVPTQYNRRLADWRRQPGLRDPEDWTRQLHNHHNADGSHHARLPEELVELLPRAVRFSHDTISEMDYAGNDLEDEWDDLRQDLAAVNENSDHNDPHRQLTLHILEHGNQPPSQPLPSAPRLPTISLSLSLSSLRSNGSGSRRFSQPVSVITVDSTQSDNSWGTQSSTFSQMPGLRSFSSTRPNSSGSGARFGLFNPQSSMESLRRRRGSKRGGGSRSGGHSDGLEGTLQPGHGSGVRRPRALPYFRLPMMEA